MNGRIYAFITATRVKWEATVPEYAEMTGQTKAEVLAEWEGDSDYDADAGLIRLEDPMEESGWVDRRWSTTVLYDSRNDVNPVVSCDLDDHVTLFEEVKDALEWLEGGYRDNGDGTFYAEDRATSHTDPWEYDYAIHFVRKFHNGTKWVEEPWLDAQEVLKREGHNPYPHTPGFLWDCQKCEDECFCTEGSAQCIHCSVEEVVATEEIEATR